MLPNYFSFASLFISISISISISIAPHCSVGSSGRCNLYSYYTLFGVLYSLVELYYPIEQPEHRLLHGGHINRRHTTVLDRLIVLLS